MVMLRLPSHQQQYVQINARSALLYMLFNCLHVITSLQRSGKGFCTNKLVKQNEVMIPPKFKLECPCCLASDFEDLSSLNSHVRFHLPVRASEAEEIEL